MRNGLDLWCRQCKDESMFYLYSLSSATASNVPLGVLLSSSEETSGEISISSGERNCDIEKCCKRMDDIADFLQFGKFLELPSGYI